MITQFIIFTVGYVAGVALPLYKQLLTKLVTNIYAKLTRAIDK